MGALKYVCVCVCLSVCRRFVFVVREYDFVHVCLGKSFELSGGKSQLANIGIFHNQ